MNKKQLKKTKAGSDPTTVNINGLILLKFFIFIQDLFHSDSTEARSAKHSSSKSQSSLKEGANFSISPQANDRCVFWKKVFI
jgi:hypothetical protein